VRQAARHFAGFEAEYYLILAGDHLYRMDFTDLIDSHIENRADITIAAQPVNHDDATQMGIFLFDLEGQITGFEEKPNAARLSQMGGSVPRGSAVGGVTAEKPFVASMGIYVFSRDILLEILEQPGVDFGKEIIPSSLATHRVHPYIFRGYWADVGTIEAFYDANINLTTRGPAFNFFHPRYPIYTHPRFLPGTRAHSCRLDAAIVAEGCYLDNCEVSSSLIGIRTRVSAGARITRSVVLGADFYEDDPAEGATPLGVGRDVVLDRVIVDKNARIGDGTRLVNAGGADHLDGHGFYIRNGIVIVPKGAEIPAGTAV
jgi:glucose-1-phosphate adenylyltransferase